MSTSSNPLDALASPTPVSEAEETLAEPGRNTMFQERAQFPDTIKDKAFCEDSQHCSSC